MFLLPSTVFSQDWSKRHAFAKAYFGIGTYYIPQVNPGTILNNNGSAESFSKAPFMTPSINIGATHFWGYADFFISITTTDISLGKNTIENNYRLGTFTGLRAYPSPTKVGKIRPFVGYAFTPMRYTQINETGEIFKHTSVKSVLSTGLSYQLSNAYLTMEYGYTVNPVFESYLSKTQKGSDAFPKSMLQVGLNWTIETTRTAATEETRKANKLFSASNDNGLFIAVGPSSAFPMKKSVYIDNIRPYLDNLGFPAIFPEFAGGYHFSKSDFVIAAAFRRMNQKRNAFGYTSTMKRQSLNLEGYKFLFDYHGFVPYLGLGISRERLDYTHSENGTALDPVSQQVWSPNVVFGWDIRPSQKGDWWLLRTNLRYFPTLRLEIDRESISQQYLEFNFIQFVLYPQRLMKIKKGL